jgi:hypothetical protein
MTTWISLDHSTLETLRHLNEPTILCDLSGRVLGTFAPGREDGPPGETEEADGSESGGLRTVKFPPEEAEEADGSSRPDREPGAGLGGSLGTYGYVADLE